ncbi:MAG TPA: NAD(P)/FAD-dependent oxidoreductase [Puia sp.]|nr:NAD(P)/FAD-dependent oxidoreductase [Puia sp.]
MQNSNELYDVALVGGGLAGLSLSILLVKANYRVALFEKEKYPFHKVCGEYISFESWNFLEELGIPLSDWNLPVIRRLMVSSPNGKYLVQDLPLGGFGISRFKLDSTLSEIAKASGIRLFEQNKVNDIVKEESLFNIKNSAGDSYTKIVCGSFGKRSNLDIKWKRNFTLTKNDKLNNYIGVKYHIKTDHPNDLIALHNFKNGYCGISQIEENKYCLCYLTTAENLRLNDNSIEKMERNLLQKNPFLKKIFTESTFLFREPITISQISFEKKMQVENNILFLGDSAGMITPLCGNGMSMALHGAKIAFHCIDDFLQNKINRDEMEKNYEEQWKKLFEKRLRTGRIIQSFFGNEFFSNLLISTVKPFPKFVSFLVKQTHGEAF